MSKCINITHLTSAHARYDTRIFLKECCSLATQEGYRVSLIVADGKGEEEKSGVAIYDVGLGNGRMERIFKTSKKVLTKAIALDSDIYHLHDPELIPIGLKLKKLGKKVIFDAHEDLPKQIMAKHYLSALSKKVLSTLIAKAEVWALKKYDAVVCATPLIEDKFSAHGIHSLAINNFPILDELIDIFPHFDTPTLCYIGLLYETRGIREIIQAIEHLEVKLIIAGKFFDPSFEAEIKGLKGWGKVDFRGFVDREGIQDILTSSLAGLVTLHPTPSYIEAYPVKMFEYMSAGIAVISSDFPLYKRFVEEPGTGVTVDPLDVAAITETIRKLIENRALAKEMGEAGKKSIRECYNWSNEEQKLFALYAEVCPCI